MAYCTPAEVGLLLKLTFDDESSPTQTEVENLILSLESEVNLVLNKWAVTPPTEDSDLFRVIGGKIALGVAGLVAMSASRSPENPEHSHGNWFYHQFTSWLSETRMDSQNLNNFQSLSGIGNQVLDGTASENATQDTPTDW